MSENNAGVNVQQQDNRNGEQNKNRRNDPARQDAGRTGSRNRNHRRRNNAGRQGGNDNKKQGGQEPQTDGKNRERNFNRDKQGGREQNNKSKRDQNQGNERKQFGQSQNFRQRKPRTREIDEVVAKNVKKVETIEDIRSDNARITKEIYLEIASLKNINLN